MSNKDARRVRLCKAYERLRHPVWAWLDVHGEEQGVWATGQSATTAKAQRPDSNQTVAPVDEAQAKPPRVPSFAEIEAQALCAFADPYVQGRLRGAHIAPPDPPGSGTLAALLADLETARLGALRAGDWREARAAVMDKAKLCAMTIAAGQEKDVPPDARPTDVIVDEALETLGAWRARRDAVTAAVRADRDRDRSRAGGGPALSPLQPAAPLP